MSQVNKTAQKDPFLETKRLVHEFLGVSNMGGVLLRIMASAEREYGKVKGGIHAEPIEHWERVINGLEASIDAVRRIDKDPNPEVLGFAVLNKASQLPGLCRQLPPSRDKETVLTEFTGVGRRKKLDVEVYDVLETAKLTLVMPPLRKALQQFWKDFGYEFNKQFDITPSQYTRIRDMASSSDYLFFRKQFIQPLQDLEQDGNSNLFLQEINGRRPVYHMQEALKKMLGLMKTAGTTAGTVMGEVPLRLANISFEANVAPLVTQLQSCRDYATGQNMTRS